MKEILKEFKTFAVRGNAIDMAIGIIIGAAFSQIVNSLVKDMIMPPIGWIVGGVDFSDLSLTLKDAVNGQEAVRINYGVFLNTVINFTIVALATFTIVKMVNRLTKQKESQPTTKKCPECQSVIPKTAKRCAHCTTLLQLPGK